MKWACAVLPFAALGCYDAVGTLKAFYQAIAEHQCEKAVNLAEGYSIERCQEVTELKLADNITVVKDGDNTVLKFSVSYKTVKASENVKDASITLKRVKDEWKVDFASFKLSELATPKPENKPEPQPQTKPPKVETKPEPKPESSVVATSVAQPTLLSLWQPEELLGKVGDEKIRYMRKPDFSAPVRTEAKALPSLAPEYLQSIRRIKLPNNKKWVALTFDLCERADEVTGYDRSIINTLREKNVKATFYVGGKWMQSHTEKTMQLMADSRFELGNHAWTHGNLRVLQGEDVRQQIVWTQAEYERLRDELDIKAQTAGLSASMNTVPESLKTLRFPFGTCSPESLQITNDLGLSAIQWDVVSGDPAITVQPNLMIQSARSGSIMIFHANGRGKGTAAALPTIIDGLRAKGFELVTVSELLAAGQPESVNECYELVRSDNIGYDAKYGNGMARIKKSKPKPKPVAEPAPLLLEPTEAQ